MQALLLAFPLLLTLADAPPQAPLLEVDPIPTFVGEYRVVASQDRLTIQRLSDGKRSTIGTGSPGAAIGKRFADALRGDPAATAAFGPALTSEVSAFGETIVLQMFDGGVAVKETATGTVWFGMHDRRRAPRRPADEIVRYLALAPFRKEYDFVAFQDRIELRRIADGKAEVVKTDAEQHDPSPIALKQFEKDGKLKDRFGAALTGEVAVFDNELLVQVFAGGAVVRDPIAKTEWHCWHRLRQRSTAAADPKAVVLTFDWRGGYTPPRIDPGPTLTVRADGTATLIDPFGKKAKVVHRLSPEELADLLNYAIRDHRFFELDTGRIAAEIKQGPRIVDAAASVLTITSESRTHEVRGYAVEPMAHRLPNAVELQHFPAIERRLIREMEHMRRPR